MAYQMKLQSVPFEKIQNGTKTIEIRLNDEKRQNFNVGDEIEFSLISDTKQTVRTQVTELTHFPTFEELFSILSPEDYGGGDWQDMYQYYSKEDEEKYGVLAIRLELI